MHDGFILQEKETIMLNKVLTLTDGTYTLPELDTDIPQGDVPGGNIKIFDTHIAKAKIVFPLLVKELAELAEAGQEKAVVCVCGGSGVGKTGIAAILAYYLRSFGIGSYVLSGDNYPHRIPMYNDAERIQVFREAGVRALAEAGLATDEVMEEMRKLQTEELDADPKQAERYPWFDCYFQHGKAALTNYLGTPKEIDFDEVSSILEAFKTGRQPVALRKMGRTDSDLWYEMTDFSDVDVVIIEWTHGNSDYLQGVDIPVYLNSTPEETLAFRKARSRDGKEDSAFVTMVLGIEQGKLCAQAPKAKIIIARNGDVLSLEELMQMTEEGSV